MLVEEVYQITNTKTKICTNGNNSNNEAHISSQNKDTIKMLKSKTIAYLLLGNQHSKSINQVMIAIELQIFLPIKHFIQQ